MSTRSLLVCLSSLVIVFGLTADASARRGAVKTDLLDGDRQAVGWVIVNTDAASRLHVKVHFDDGEPKAQFGIDVKINRMDRQHVGKVKTNKKGKGNGKGKIPLPAELKTDDSIFVRVFVFDREADQYGTMLIEVPLKKPVRDIEEDKDIITGQLLDGDRQPVGRVALLDTCDGYLKVKVALAEGEPKKDFAVDVKINREGRAFLGAFMTDRRGMGVFRGQTMIPEELLTDEVIHVRLFVYDRQQDWYGTVLLEVPLCEKPPPQPDPVTGAVLDGDRDPVGRTTLQATCEGSMKLKVSLADAEPSRLFAVDVKINSADSVLVGMISTDENGTGQLELMVPIPRELLDDKEISVRLFLYDRQQDWYGTELLTVPLCVKDDLPAPTFGQILDGDRDPVGRTTLQATCSGNLMVTAGVSQGEPGKAFGVDVQINREDRMFIGSFTTDRGGAGALTGQVMIPGALLGEEMVYARLFLYDRQQDWYGTELLGVSLCPDNANGGAGANGGAD